MSENIQDLLQEYENAKIKAKAFRKKFDSYFLTTLKISLGICLGLFLMTCFYLLITFGLKDTVRIACDITTSAFVLLFIGMLLCIVIEPIIEFYSQKEKIKRRIKKEIYTGDLYVLFDKNCVHTTKVLNKHKDSLSKEIFNDKGMKGYVILLLKSLIEKSIKEANIAKQEADEKEALIQAETKVGNLLKAIKEA